LEQAPRTVASKEQANGGELMSWWKKWLGQPNNVALQHQAHPVLNPRNAGIAFNDPRFAAGKAQRKTYWARKGTIEPNSISYRVNPETLGAPPWPSIRQTFVIVRTADSLIIASDGLSDPFIGTDNHRTNGYGIEVFLEMFGAQQMSVEDIMASVAFALIESVAQCVAGIEYLSFQLENEGVVTMEVPCRVGLGSAWQADDGAVGVLLGLGMPDREGVLVLPFGPLRMVSVTVLTVEELAFVVGNGVTGPSEMNEKLLAAGVGHAFVPDRGSVA
jgi:hypothetical protein